ncbi:uncharacterized protein [Nicotiana tomentosiformis]|uniref:uncharacterized protein n=1 Tax=Nicotiana tomentosiformis TaxID=4098 RepID=UPI00388CC4E7
MLALIVASQSRRSNVAPTPSSHPGDSASSRLNRFLQLDPPVFTGTDPEEDPQKFIDEMHKTLRVMHATETKGEELPSYRLKGVSYSWFEMWEESREGGNPPARWSEFTDAFMDHFLHAETKAYAIHMLPTMEARVRRFVHGLSPLVINEAATATLNSDMNYGKMVAFVQAIETRKLKNIMERQSSSKAQSTDNFGVLLVVVVVGRHSG